jgi:hypothetical protein
VRRRLCGQGLSAFLQAFRLLAAPTTFSLTDLALSLFRSPIAVSAFISEMLTSVRACVCMFVCVRSRRRDEDERIECSCQERTKGAVPLQAPHHKTLFVSASLPLLPPAPSFLSLPLPPSPSLTPSFYSAHAPSPKLRHLRYAQRKIETKRKWGHFVCMCVCEHTPMTRNQSCVFTRVLTHSLTHKHAHTHGSVGAASQGTHEGV